MRSARHGIVVYRRDYYDGPIAGNLLLPNRRKLFQPAGVGKAPSAHCGHQAKSRNAQRGY